MDRYLLDGGRAFLILIAAAFALYSKTIFFGYTHLDDNVLIINNMAFLQDPASILRAFSQKVFAASHLPYYRPVLLVSFIIDTHLGLGSPAAYHITNILLHALASCLVLKLLLRLGYDRLRSFLISMVFVVHPVLSQAVAWIPGRNDTLLAIFTIASFLSLCNYLKTGRFYWYLCQAALFLAALFTKETALILIPVGALYMHLIAGEKRFSPREALIILGWAVASCIWYSLRQNALNGSAGPNIFEMASIVFMHLPAAIQFTGKIFFPFNLSVFPTIQDTAFIYGYLAIASVALAVIFTKERRNNFIMFGLAWAILFLLPSLLRANYRISADFLEHRVYVPVIGVFIVLLETDLIKKAKRPVLIVLAAIVISLFSAITFRHIEDFKDRLAFWASAVKTSGHSSFAHLAMGITYHDLGELDKAEAQYRETLAIEPSEPGAFYQLGKVYIERGMFREAERELSKTIALSPAYCNAYIELGALYYKEGRLKEAEWAWSRAIKIEPDNPLTNKFLAILYHDLKDPKRSLEHVRKIEGLGGVVPPEFVKSLGAK